MNPRPMAGEILCIGSAEVGNLLCPHAALVGPQIDILQEALALRNLLLIMDFQNATLSV